MDPWLLYLPGMMRPGCQGFRESYHGPLALIFESRKPKPWALTTDGASTKTPYMPGSHSIIIITIIIIIIVVVVVVVSISIVINIQSIRPRVRTPPTEDRPKPGPRELERRRREPRQSSDAGRRLQCGRRTPGRHQYEGFSVPVSWMDQRGSLQ